jgi:hypothetical protein
MFQESARSSGLETTFIFRAQVVCSVRAWCLPPWLVGLVAITMLPDLVDWDTYIDQLRGFDAYVEPTKSLDAFIRQTEAWDTER